MSDKSEKVCGIASVILTVMNTVGLVLFAVGFIQIREAFRAIYVDFEVALPGVTQICVSVPTPAFIVVVLVLLAALIAKEFLRPRWLALVLNAIWVGVGGMLLAFFTLAMFIPMIQLITAMSE